MSDIYEKVAEKIIEEQEHIIGPVAYDQAKKVNGLKVDQAAHSVILEGDKKSLIEALVKQYEKLFGGTSVEVCKDAIKDFNLPKDQLPPMLQ